jgi:conjugal transfer pilus assembly protein TraB
MELLKNLKLSLLQRFSVFSSFLLGKRNTQLNDMIDTTSDKDINTNSNQILKTQAVLAGGILLVIVIAVIAFLNVGFGGNGKAKTNAKNNKEESKKIKVEVASQALDPDRMWRNHFEDKLHETQETTSAQLAKISETIHAKSEETLSQTQNDIKELKSQLIQARDSLELAANELREARLSANDSNKEFDNIIEANLQSSIIEDEMNTHPPRDSTLYIPETGYVTGTLLGGISVSTSVGSSSEPVPVVIRLTGRGNLPKSFKADLSGCRILGSSYGDLSSERAVIRAETLVCENKELEEIVTTKVSGLVFGDDGMNGIKGKVVDMSTKHIKNAAIGGMLSGFAGTMKSQGQFSLSSLGAVNTKDPGIGSRLKDNTLSGVGNAAEKIADYYIKQAENMSPVLLIPGGSRVDVMFTKGVYLGSTDIVRTIENERKNQTNEPR